MPKIFGQENIPKWYIVYNFLGMLPALAWPFVAFISIFLFDNPSNIFLSSLIFILIIGYPGYLLGIIILGFRLFHSYKTIALILPFLLISTVPFVAFWLLN